MCKIDFETFMENTRNDSYVVIDKNKKNGIVISYAKNLCKCVNKAFSLNLNYSETALNDYKDIAFFS